MNNDQPILVTGAHRSGTTWVGRTLSQHPKVTYIHEPFNVDHPNPLVQLELENWFTHYPSSYQKKELKRAFDRLLGMSRIERAWRGTRLAKPSLKMPVRFSRTLLRELVFRPALLVKDPIALLSADWLYEAYNFKVIVTIRNPLAFAGSLKKAGWDFDFENLKNQKHLMNTWLNDHTEEIDRMIRFRHKFDLIDRAALLWKILHSVIIKYQKRYPEWLYMRHEDLARNPVSNFNRIFKYVALRPDEKIIDYIRQYTSKRNQPESASTSYQPRDSRSVLQNWRKRLTDEEVNRVIAVTHEVAAEWYHYEDNVMTPRALV